MKPDLIIILGPTASGKTKLAASLAKTLQSEIISADSRQVYSNMNIGTGKDYDEYLIDNYKIPTHLIDIVPVGNAYHIDQFKNDFKASFNSITAKSKIPILCGGSGLYIDAVISNYQFTAVPKNEQLRQQLVEKNRDELIQIFSSMPPSEFTSVADTSTTKRLIRAIEITTFLMHHPLPKVANPVKNPIIFGLNLPLRTRRENIEKRLKYRLQNGLIEEVQQLLKQFSPEQLIYYGLEYKYVTHYLTQKMAVAELETQLTAAIQQYAKRQMTYFRKMERDGKIIHWIDASQPPQNQLTELITILNYNK